MMGQEKGMELFNWLKLTWDAGRNTQTFGDSKIATLSYKLIGFETFNIIFLRICFLWFRTK